jgi:two-component system response regulator HydG
MPSSAVPRTRTPLPRRRFFDEPPEPPRVLVAEHDRTMSERICSTLRDAGFDVMAANDPRDLADTVRWMAPPNPRLTPPDVVVSDARMDAAGGLGGLALVRHFDGSVPVIVITETGDRETAMEAERLGAALVLDERMHMEELCSAVMALAPQS